MLASIEFRPFVEACGCPSLVTTVPCNKTWRYTPLPPYALMGAYLSTVTAFVCYIPKLYSAIQTRGSPYRANFSLKFIMSPISICYCCSMTTFNVAEKFDFK
jgi:hypothetical protein